MTTTEFRLYCFAQSGNAYKAALTLQLCGAKWQPRFVDFFNGETRTPEYREKVNEMGEVPVLEHAGKRLSQSGVILHYLAEHFGKFQGEDKREVLRWILWDNHKLTSYIATLRRAGTRTKIRRIPPASTGSRTWRSRRCWVDLVPRKHSSPDASPECQASP